MSRFDFIEQELSRRDHQQRHRRLRNLTPVSATEVEIDGKRMVNFCSNDYLGLAKHPLLKEKAISFTEHYGTGSTASRLICGSFDCHKAIEEKLARLKGVESTLLFNSGFQANVSIIPALVDRNSLVLSDRLNHNSIIQGITLARCQKQLFDHNNLDHLESLLDASRNDGHSRRLIVTESVFSMDGDQADIDRLVQIAHRHDALLMVDEAHATGVLGEAGMGLTVGRDVDVTMGTFGKALGSFGAYVASSSLVRDYLINCCSGFIYTTALPPATLGAINAALDLVPAMDAQRLQLHENAEFLRNMLQQLGYNTGSSSTQIIPVLIGEEQDTLMLSAALEAAGYLATAIRPPTVPQGESRIRIALSAAHTREQLEGLIEVFRHK